MERKESTICPFVPGEACVKGECPLYPENKAMADATRNRDLGGFVDIMVRPSNPHDTSRSSTPPGSRVGCVLLKGGNQ